MLTLLTFSALVFCVLSGVVIVFQLALIAGAPWGELTLGGRWRGSLPMSVRIIPLVSILIITFFICTVLRSSQLVVLSFPSFTENGVWIAVTYCILGIFANAFSPSIRERRLWVPVLVMMTASSLSVALLA